MTNELSDTQMLQKVWQASKLTFILKDTVDIVWMSQDTLAEFFEVSRKELITCLSSVIKDNNLDKSKHIRSISYVKNSLANAVSIQERQYSFCIICLVSFSINSDIAIAFRLWIISNFDRFLKWGIIVNPKRIQSSEKRKQYFDKQIKKV